MEIEARKELEEDLEGELDFSSVEGSADRSEEGVGEERLGSWQKIYPIEEIEELATELDRESVPGKYSVNP